MGSSGTGGSPRPSAKRTAGSEFGSWLARAKGRADAQTAGRGVGSAESQPLDDDERRRDGSARQKGCDANLSCELAAATVIASLLEGTGGQQAAACEETTLGVAADLTAMLSEVPASAATLEMMPNDLGITLVPESGPEQLVAGQVAPSASAPSLASMGRLPAQVDGPGVSADEALTLRSGQDASELVACATANTPTAQRSVVVTVSSDGPLTAEQANQRPAMRPLTGTDTDLVSSGRVSVVEGPTATLRSVDEMLAVGSPMSSQRSDRRQALNDRSDRQIPIRYGSAYVLSRSGTDQADAGYPKTELSLNLSESISEPVVQDLDGPAAGEPFFDRSVAAREETRAEKASDPFREHLLTFGDASLTTSAHPASHAVDRPEPASLPRQLETLLLEARDVHLSTGEATEMRVVLEPKELGKLSMRISMDNGLITASFEAESQIVKQLIEAELPRLRDSLQEQGIRLEQAFVQVGGGQADGSAGRQMRDQRPNWLYRQRYPLATSPARIAATTTSGAAGRVRLGSAIDYLV